MTVHHFSVRIDPRLADILAILEGTTIGADFRNRALRLATSGVLGEPIDHRAALRSQLWMLERLGTNGINLTAAGYLKPADVRAAADVLPTMADWIFRVTTEVHTQPVLNFRRHLARVGLLRKNKGVLLATRKGQSVVKDPDLLWAHLASTLIPNRPAFIEMASVVVLVHMGTTDGRIDVQAVARTLGALGWAHPGGERLDERDVHPVSNDLWAALGNVGDRAPTAGSFLDRTLSPAATEMIRQALFTDAPPSTATSTRTGHNH